MCLNKGCTRERCRELAHHGVTFSARDCPGCRGQTGAALIDHTHALGVTHVEPCGTYFIPSTLPAELLETAQPWERGRWSNIGRGKGAEGELMEAAA